MEEQLEGVWKPRLAAAADPFECSLQRERVRGLHFLHASSICVVQLLVASPWNQSSLASPRNLMKSEVACQE